MTVPDFPDEKAPDAHATAISLTGAALQGFNGVGNFVFNTGHNDAIQGNVTVNIVMAP